MPSLLARSNSSSRRDDGAEWSRAERVMVTMDTTCAAIWSARGVRSTMRKLTTQATMLAAIRKASRKKVRQYSPLPSQAKRVGRTSMWLTQRSVSTRLSFRNEDVAQSPDRLDIQGIGRIRFNQLAQARDLHVQAAVEYLVLAPARKFHQLFTRQRLPRMPRKHLEHGKLASRQCDALAALLQCACAQVEHEL